MHKYLTELTGNDYSNVPYISAYSNYIGYSTTSKTYLLGKDYNTITKEKYECSNLEITDNKDGLYTAKANVIIIITVHIVESKRLTFSSPFVSLYVILLVIHVINTPFYATVYCCLNVFSLFIQ